MKNKMPNPNKQKSNKCEKCGHYNTCKNHCQSEYLCTCGCPINVSTQEENKEKSECNCKEMSCQKDCNSRHTHKGFFCEKCHPERYEIKEDKCGFCCSFVPPRCNDKDCQCHTPTPPIASEVKEECKDLNCKEHYGEEHFFHPENWDKILMEIISDCWRKDDEVGLFKGLKDLLSQAITTERNRIVAMIDEIDTTKFLTMEFTGGYRTALSDIKDLLTQIKK